MIIEQMFFSRVSEEQAVKHSPILENGEGKTVFLLPLKKGIIKMI